mmetsp:Transcript_13329/g.29474  ORF Transcript_13329/g.29474 Transcript_13329/m.29474 type:complete len:101 (+) Transcript_13329:1026-1328(+)
MEVFSVLIVVKIKVQTEKCEEEDCQQRKAEAEFVLLPLDFVILVVGAVSHFTEKRTIDTSTTTSSRVVGLHRPPQLLYDRARLWLLCGRYLPVLVGYFLD